MRRNFWIAANFNLEAIFTHRGGNSDIHVAASFCAQRIFAAVMKDERAPTSRSSSRPGTQQSKEKKQDWRISFRFWTELDALYHSFPPPTKPRCPALPLDSASEWYSHLSPWLDHLYSNVTDDTCDVGRSVLCRMTSKGSWGIQRQRQAFARPKVVWRLTLHTRSPISSSV